MDSNQKWFLQGKGQYHTWGLHEVKQDKSKSVKATCPLVWSRIFSGFKSLYIIPVNETSLNCELFTDSMQSYDSDQHLAETQISEKSMIPTIKV